MEGFKDEQVVFAVDLQATRNAGKGIGISSGWTVAAASPADMSVNVVAGVGYVESSEKETTVTTNLAIAAAHATLHRKDIVVWDTDAGALAVVTGTPAAITLDGETDPVKMLTPAPPEMEADDDILVAEVYVAAATASIGNSDIVKPGPSINKSPNQIITTQGDVIQGGASGVPERLAAGTSGQYLTAQGAGAKSQWTTHGYLLFVPVTSGTNGITPSAPPYAALSNLNDLAGIAFDIPDSFNSLTEAKIIAIPTATQAAANWDISSAYGANETAYTTHQESDTATTYNATANEYIEVDVSGILASLAAGDRGGIYLQLADATHDVKIVGLEIRYT